MPNRSTGMTIGEKLVVRSQFQEMLTWLGRGWVKAPPGRMCPECGGPVWLKVFGRRERHSCSYCLWSQEYQVK